jgi:hypothetical protein
VAAVLDLARPELRSRDVPGFAVAVVARGEAATGAAGVRDVDGAPVTADSRFYVASVTRTCTALLLAKFANDDRLELDDPVRTSLPQFTLADEAAAASLRWWRDVRESLVRLATDGGGASACDAALDLEERALELYAAPPASGDRPPPASRAGSRGGSFPACESSGRSRHCGPVSSSARLRSAAASPTRRISPARSAPRSASRRGSGG